jgi:hypothetical protein
VTRKNIFLRQESNYRSLKGDNASVTELEVSVAPAISVCSGHTHWPVVKAVVACIFDFSEGPAWSNKQISDFGGRHSK